MRSMTSSSVMKANPIIRPQHVEHSKTSISNTRIISAAQSIGRANQLTSSGMISPASASSSLPGSEVIELVTRPYSSAGGSESRPKASESGIAGTIRLPQAWLGGNAAGYRVSCLHSDDSETLRSAMCNCTEFALAS